MSQRKALGRATSIEDITRIHWTEIYIGFEGNALLPEKDREEQVTSSRRAIQETFTPAALERWASRVPHSAKIKEGESYMDALARVLADELNTGRQPGCKWKFSIRAEDAFMRVMRSSGAPFSPGPDIKPEGVVCKFVNGLWNDEMEGPIWVEPVDESGGATTAAKGRGRAQSNHLRGHLWKPDARHGLFARIVFNCPFEKLSQPLR